MNKEFKEILVGIKRAIQLLNTREKRSLIIAIILMLIIGILTNLPAVILGKLVDTLTSNEAIIQENIEKQFKGKTIITIAHRLTTLKNSDKILVFDKGKIIQEGDYRTLSKTKGLFQDFLQQRTERS